MARRLDMAVMDMHVVPLVDIAVLVVHVVDMVVEFQNMLKQLRVFNTILKYSSTWWRSVVWCTISYGPYGGVLNCAASWE